MSTNWSLNDKRFMRSLRILADAPPVPSPRFVVEPGVVDGEFHVVDRRKVFTDHIFGKGWKDRRASAESFAEQMNTKHLDAEGDGA